MHWLNGDSMKYWGTRFLTVAVLLGPLGAQQPAANGVINRTQTPGREDPVAVERRRLLRERSRIYTADHGYGVADRALRDGATWS